MEDLIQVKNAFISVYDKTELSELGEFLREYDVNLVSSGKTKEFLKGNGIYFNSADEKSFDLVVCNLCPSQDKIENFDVVGHDIITSSAKNYKKEAVLTDPSQYDYFMNEVCKNSGCTSLDARKKLATEAFRKTASYNTSFYDKSLREFSKERFPDTIIKVYDKVREHRYAENPHQVGALYNERGKVSIADSNLIIQNKQISYNNDLDADSMLKASLELQRFMDRNRLEGYSSAWFKHTSPTGMCFDKKSPVRCIDNTFKTDGKSAFGGGGSTTFKATGDISDYFNKNKIFLELFMSPGFTEKAKSGFKEKKNRRLMDISPIYDKYDELHEGFRLQGLLGGGTLFQEYNKGFAEKFNIVSKRKPQKDHLLSADFAQIPTLLAKSNSAVFVKPYYDEKLLGIKTLGVGCGQQSRVDVIELAARKAKSFNHDLKDSIMFTDSFLPFRDGLDEAVDAGATTLVTYYGSLRDEEVIDASNERDVSLVHVDKRYFRH